MCVRLGEEAVRMPEEGWKTNTRAESYTRATTEGERERETGRGGNETTVKIFRLGRPC